VNTAGRRVLYSEVTFSVRRVRGGTVVTVRHGPFPPVAPWLSAFGGSESGWGYFLLNLRSVVEFGRDLRSPLDD
jgi:hypothetical protein